MVFAPLFPFPYYGPPLIFDLRDLPWAFWCLFDQIIHPNIKIKICLSMSVFLSVQVQVVRKFAGSWTPQIPNKEDKLCRKFHKFANFAIMQQKKWRRNKVLHVTNFAFTNFAKLQYSLPSPKKMWVNEQRKRKEHIMNSKKVTRFLMSYGLHNL